MTTVRESAAAAVAARQMAEVASAFLDALDAGQRAKASFDFGDVEERTNWAYYPRIAFGQDHSGLPLLEMSPKQQKLAHALIAGSLSLHAYAKVTAIMALESVLNHMEEGRFSAGRDPGRYFFSFFGAPSDERWGWRLEGHHVCLNFTIAGGEVVSPTPLFLGANPAEVRHGVAAVIRPCGEEEDAARDLLASLDADQRGIAVICPIAPPDFVLMNAPLVPETCLPGELGSLPPIQAMAAAMPAAQREALRFERSLPRGLAGAEMSETQRKVLSELIDVYVHRLAEPLAAIERVKIDRATIDLVHFAWAGEAERRRPHYYRLQGPSFLVEYDNTQNEANHVHAVWRNPDGDFGRDILREHIRGAH
jgi:hypothetical protein